MRNISIHYLFRLAFFWLVYFTLFRLLFIIYHNDLLPDGHLANTFLALFAGWRLDLSTACYLITIPFLLWVLQQFVRHRWVHRINHIYNILLILTVSLINMSNIRIYGEWNTMLNARALQYLSNPQEVLSFASTGSIIIGILVWLITAAAGVFIYRSLVTGFSFPVEKMWARIALAVIFPVLLFIGLRGGIQLTPVNESAAYYSTHIINNKIATNSVWYLIHSLLEAGSQENPYAVMDSKAAASRTGRLLEWKDDQTPQVLTTQTPNIVFIVLESWTADVADEKNVTPEFNKLASEGLLFTQAYGSGFRTDQGLAAIISGFPAQPHTSIITTPDKGEKLPSLAKVFTGMGYKTASFYYGGDVNFANMKTYLISAGFGKIVDKTSFDKDELNSKWGAHDGHVLDRQLEELKSEKEPFFSVVLTLSTHEPFEVPAETPFNGNDNPSRFRKAAYYTDKCLGEYFEEAKKEKWYANTLFVLVADHGHRLPKEQNLAYAASRRIAMLMCGGALKEEYKGKTFDKIVEQTGIAATLLVQMKREPKEFPWKDFTWSRNFLSPGYKEFAYYSLENMLGWVTPQQSLVFTYSPPEVIRLEGRSPAPNDSLLLDGKAYLQTLYEQYLAY